jgi:hypothetical protein
MYRENAPAAQSAWLMVYVIAVGAPNAVPGTPASTRSERQALAALVWEYRMMFLIFLV